MIHFHETGGKSTLEMKKDIESFLRANGAIRKAKVGENIDPMLMMKVYKYCEQLKNKGFLLDFGNHRKVPILGNKYINLGNDLGLGEYGGYDFLLQGFQLIQKAFSGSVLKVVVQDEIGDYGIGTCFLIAENLIVMKASLFLKASLFFGQFKNELFLDYEERKIHGDTDCCDVATVRIRD